MLLQSIACSAAGQVPKYNFYSQEGFCGTHVTKMILFPMFLKLRGRNCLVVGAGKISEGKIAGLLAAGANVRVVAPEATPRIQKWNRSKKIRWASRAYASGDLRNVFLVVAATSSKQVQKQIFRDARRRGVLCNVVDVPELCDFYYPSVVRRGNLQIAISTAGASPSLAKRLRRQFEKQFGPEYARWLRHLAERRQKVRSLRISLAEKNRILEQQASAAGFSSFMKKSALLRRAARKKSGR